MSSISNEKTSNDENLNITNDAIHNSLNKGSFTPLQSRKLPQSSMVPCAKNFASICSSMDLIAFGFKSNTSKQNNSKNNESIKNWNLSDPIMTADMIVVHRILSWQKLLNVHTTDLLSTSPPPPPPPSPSPSSSSSSTSKQHTKSISEEVHISGASSLCWSPDGRALAIGLADGGIHIYIVEDGGGSHIIHSIPPNLRYNHDIDYHTLEKSTNVNRANTTDVTSKTNKVTPVFSPPLTRSKAAARQKAASKQTKKKDRNYIHQENMDEPQNQQQNQQQQHSKDDALNALKQNENQSKPYSNAIICMNWARINPHSEQQIKCYHHDHYQQDYCAHKQLTMKIRARYLDRAHHFVQDPIQSSTTSEMAKSTTMDSNYHNQTDVKSISSSTSHSNQNIFNPIISVTQPTTKTSLSLLAILNDRGYLCLYLHGRYLIAQIPPPPPSSSSTVSLSTPPKKSSEDHKTNESYAFPATGIHAPDIVFTPDLSSILISNHNHNHKHKQQPSMNTILHLHSIPDLCLRRQELQQLAPSYCNITKQISYIKKGIQDALTKWKDSLKPLDMKLSSMRNLLRDYGVIPKQQEENDDKHSTTNNKQDHYSSNHQTNMKISPKSEILNLIFRGNTHVNNHALQKNNIHERNANASSDALIQFFSTHMNEHGLNRMTTACEIGLTSVEATVRQHILKPAQALVYATSELYGLARIMRNESCLWGNDEYEEEHPVMEGNSWASYVPPKPLISHSTALDLQRYSEELYLVTEQCLSQIIVCRHRLRDFLRWMTGTLTAVKAHGTAMDSFERKNAKKARPSQADVNHVSSFLLLSLKIEYERDQNSIDSKQDRDICETEDILGIPILDYFQNDHVSVYTEEKFVESKFDHPWDGMSPSVSEFHMESTPSIKAALNSVEESATFLFSRTNEVVSQSIKTHELVFSYNWPHDSNDTSNSSTPCISIHKRIGMFYDDSTGGFSPNLAKDLTHEEIQNLRIQQWLLVAKSDKINDDQSVIHLVYFPCMKHDEDTDEMVSFPQFYLQGFMKLPHGCSLKEIAFYGDDGNSSILGNAAFDETDILPKEGRQALALLVVRETRQNMKMETDDQIEESDTLLSEELWILKYDKVRLQVKYFDDSLVKRINIDTTLPLDSDEIAQVLDINEDDMDDMEYSLNDERDVVKIYARNRQFQQLKKAKNSTLDNCKQFQNRLVVNGSRGIGGVITNGNILGLFDLEEDEEADDSDEDSESENSQE